MSDINLRSDYRKFMNRCFNCGHRLEMHKEEGQRAPCTVRINGHLPDTSKDRRCNCRNVSVE